MPAIQEFHIQRAVCIWLRTPGVLVPGVVWWHTPNGGTRRDAFEGKRLAEMGLLPGFPDLAFLWGGLSLLELKKERGTLSDAQIELHPRLIAAGARVATANSLATAKAAITAWGLTVNAN